MEDDNNDVSGEEADRNRTRLNVAAYIPNRSFGLKLLLVCGLALLMAIPTMFVWGLVHERSSNADKAVREVSHARGGQQVVLGPVLSVPYEQMITERAPTGLNGAMVDVQRKKTGQFVVYAKKGKASADLKTEMLKRGLHRVPVFDVKVEFDASFDLEQAMLNRPRGAKLLWDEARIHMGMSDLRGVKDEVLVEIGKEIISLGPGNNTLASSLSDMVGGIKGVELNENVVFDLKASMRLTGAQRMGFAAFAQNSEISLTGDWAAPSFEGGFLPADREVTDAGFSAVWRVPYLARGVEASGGDLQLFNLVNSNMGLSLLDEASPYQSVMRALKYAPMFVGLVFLAYFLFETTSSVRAHPAQYVLVGLAQAVFYLLLLGVSEHAGFTLGFIFAATATVLALSLYAGAVFGGKEAQINAFIVFTSLYALIYVLMRMQDYALLVGSIASFAAIAFTMWKTRDLDWYGLSGEQTKRIS
ncbi:cell envelope integrity protein CreD [Hirschia maritima]|uniref:cell envelope integrity protein CreD n=1 Tax=Hirschia maritima TaxID=1121961 RepID=UPI00036F4457|nr:cell envelope integrity protein CreD [Hirschia maritima]